jgi:hypothetical protein
MYIGPTPFLCQQNPLWAYKRIGVAPFTLGQKGCAITEICESMKAFDLQILPDEIASNLYLTTDRNHKEGPGLVIWSRVAEYLSKKFGKNITITRYTGRNDAMIRGALKPGYATLLQVSYGSHWVKADRKSWIWTDYVCRDPWTGKACTALGDYTNITGYAVIKVV